MPAPTAKREICGERIKKDAASENSRRGTAAASPEISPSRIQSAGASRDRSSHCEAPKDAPRPPEIETLCRAWRAAVTPARALPPYEELALGSLGRLADSAALIRAAEPDKFEILMAGSTIEAWIDQPSRQLQVNQRSSGLVRALHDAVTRALKNSAPAEGVARAVVNGLVRSYDLVALPLSNRWGPPLCQVYMKERDQIYSLVDAIFSVADEGIVALAVICDESRVASDFEIVALNDGAARLLRRRADDLCGRRFSEAFGNMGVDDMLANLLEVAAKGGSSRFEIDHVSRPGENVQLTVNATAIGDLIGMTLTDITEIKAREASFRQLFDGSPMPTALCDPESFGFLAVNEAAAMLWGFPREALLAMTSMMSPCQRIGT